MTTTKGNINNCGSGNAAAATSIKRRLSYKRRSGWSRQFSDQSTQLNSQLNSQPSSQPQLNSQPSSQSRSQPSSQPRSQPSSQSQPNSQLNSQPSSQPRPQKKGNVPETTDRRNKKNRPHDGQLSCSLDMVFDLMAGLDIRAKQAFILLAEIKKNLANLIQS